MATPREIGRDFREKLNMRAQPLGFAYMDHAPEGANTVREPGQGCIMPLLNAATKGRAAWFGPGSAGWPCSAFYLGFADSIFPGIELYLSQGPLPGRECERFVRTPGQVEEYLHELRFKAPENKVAVVQPLEMFTDGLRPEVAVFFATPDQLSALVFLLHFDAPRADDRVVTRFASACASALTLPLAYARTGQAKAVWGMHDISARKRLPKDLMSLAMPYFLLEDIHALIPESFLTTSQWVELAARA